VNRLVQALPFTEAQAGARKGRSTQDQVFTLKGVINHRTQQGKPTYLAFLDVKQAYDSVWKAAVLLNLWEKGIKGKMWRVLRALNNDLTAQILTRFGLTKEIPVLESLRQGGIASGVEFASLMDQAQTELEAEGLGVRFHNILISALLLMDDVVLLAESPKMLQRMLDVLDKLALRAHLLYNTIKSKIMVINAPQHKSRTWFVGDLILEETLIYTYLGEVIASSMSMSPHLTHLTQRSYAVSTTMYATSAEPVLAKIKMNTLFQLYETCWLKAILYNSETWQLSKTNLQQLTQLQLNTLRRILKIPRSTPKVAIYGETGILPIEYEMHKRQLSYYHTLLNADKIAALVLQKQIQHPNARSWAALIDSLLEKYNLTYDTFTIRKFTKQKWKGIVKKAINRDFYQWYVEACQKSKMINIFAHKKDPTKALYMKELSRNQAATIFRLRCKMTTSGANTSTTPKVCRWCKNGHESDLHLFEYCMAEKIQASRSKYKIGSINAIFKNNPNLNELKQITEFVKEIGILPDGFEWVQ